MNGFQHDGWVLRRSGAGQWATGALKALATIAFSALLIWIAVSVVKDSGLLAPAASAPADSPSEGSHFARHAYG
jgi:hypothetical protein